MTEAAASTRLDLTKTQTNTYFTISKQMEVEKEMLAQLGKEGIEDLEDLVEFSKDIWKHAAEKLKRPGGRMKNPDKRKDGNNPAMAPQTPYLFGTRTVAIHCSTGLNACGCTEDTQSCTYIHWKFTGILNPGCGNGSKGQTRTPNMG
eukprot:10044730-Ditylum_brightwellii.AAC.1